MESKFTPPPWNIDKEAMENGKQWAITGIGTAVAFIPAKHTHAEANAHLIGAAPDMIEAIKFALEIRDLWAPILEKPVSPQHEEEMQALTSMEEKFKSVLTKTLNITDGK